MTTTTIFVLHRNGAPIMTTNSPSAKVRRHRPMAFATATSARRAAEQCFWHDLVDIIPMPLSEWSAMSVDA